MRKRRLIALSIACAVVATALLTSTRLTPAQSGGARAQEQSPPFYNPYPPGILPADLPQEIERVRREVRFIEKEAMAQWRALPPPTLTGQPPILAHTGQRANVLLGKLMNFDENISPFKNRACGFCHMPYAGFSGSIPSVNLTMIAYPGSLPYRAGKRTAQRYTYSPDFPVLNHNDTQNAFLEEASGIRGRLVICWGVLTPIRHRALRSIRWKWACRTPLASRGGYPLPSTARSSSWFGARISISIGPPTPSRSAPPPKGRSPPPPRRLR